MRSDALRNRERALDVAVALVLEVGGEPRRDAIADRAGLGIGTLYRHFPDRQSLLHAVVRHVLERTIAAGEAIVAADMDGMDAIREYMHAALDCGIGVVNMILPLLDDTNWPDLLTRADSLMNELVTSGRSDERLPVDLEVGDIVFATIRFGRPLAIGLAAADDRAIAHRQLDRYIDGLRPSTTSTKRRKPRRA